MEKLDIELLHLLLLVSQTCMQSYVVTLSANPMNDWLLVVLSDLASALDHFIYHEVCVALVRISLDVTISLLFGEVLTRSRLDP